MTTSDWLDARRRELTPTSMELREVQDALDEVCRVLRSEHRIAEVRACGSAAKGTMLRGRKEADVVLIMHDAPDPQTLEYFRSLLEASPEVRNTAVHYKAVAAVFRNGVSVDVLPAAQHGLTEGGGSIPRKHRRVLDGPKHVVWFSREGQAVGAHDIVRLLKNWRDVQGLSSVLSSFGLEVLTVEALRTARRRNLEEKLASVLARLAQGEIAVQDPARPSEWVNNLTQNEQARVRDAANKSLEYLQQGNPSMAFAGRSYPGSLSGLGGTPLA